MRGTQQDVQELGEPVHAMADNISNKAGVSASQVIVKIGESQHVAE